jgi:hypothetical protein
MVKRVAYRVVRPLLEAIVDASADRNGQLPMPDDSPVIHAIGPDPDRLLMVGGATVQGVGVTSHELGLGGHFARRLSMLTGRGVDLELASSETLTFEQAVDRTAEYDLPRFDAVILVMGIREAAGWAPIEEWSRGLSHLLDAVSTVPQVFVLGVPDFTANIALPSIIARITVRRIGRYNAAARAISQRIPGVEFVPFIPAPVVGFAPFGSTTVYERWADSLAPSIALGLDPRRHVLRPLERVDENVRQSALDALGVIDSGVDERVDRIARMARDLLGASGASVTFLDHDRQWIKSAVSMSRSDMERAESFCNTTISRPRLFVVEDAAVDEVFSGHPWVVGEERVRFYAGYPLEAPEGVRVGALCVVDTKPRHFSRTEAALLRELALRVQALLWSGSRHTLGE